MSTIEILIIIAISGFVLFIICLLLGVDFKKLFSAKPKSKDKPKKEKPKKTKKNKPIKEKVKENKKQKESVPSNSRIEKVSGKDAGKTIEEIEQEKKPLENQTSSKVEMPDKGFKITKKGVAKIHKKALERDSRSMAKIEPAIVKTKDGFESSEQVKYESFDDLLNKMKSIGDPDALDDETFRKMFLSNQNTSDESEKLDFDDEMSDDFVSLESSSEGDIDRRLKHFSIDGKHLGENVNDGFPQRRPMLPDHIDFTERITGRYENIRMGDVSNRLAPVEDASNENKSNQISEKEDESDEDIFAKIMERRRREMGLEIGKNAPDEENEDIKDFDMETLVVADAIMNPSYKKFTHHNNKFINSDNEEN